MLKAPVWRDTNFATAFQELKRSGQANVAELFTRYTGGVRASFFGRSAMEQALHRVGDVLHRQYLLTFTPRHSGEQGFHSIQVSIRNRPELDVRTRAGYWVLP